MKKFILEKLRPIVKKYYPKQLEVTKITTILVKKGRIKEWRSYDHNHNRIDYVH